MSGFGVKISRGTVTHWKNGPLTTYEQARECRDAIRDYTGEEGEVVEVLASIALPSGGGSGGVAAGETPEEPGALRSSTQDASTEEVNDG
jgi:hypothetical protein